MSGEKDLEQLKKEAAAKAKAAAQAKLQAKQQKESALPTGEPDADAKAKAAAAAKAKAAALAKQKASSATSDGSSDDAAAKAKAAAAAKAKAAALAKQKASSATSGGNSDDADAKAKAIAAAKAKAAAAAKAKVASGGPDDEKAKAIAKAKAAAALKAKTAGKVAKSETDSEQEPSPNQKYLDKYVKVIKEHLGDDVLEDYYINRLSKDVPTLVAKAESYYKIAEFLKYNEQLGFDYLSELHGTDFKTHMEVYVHLFSYKNRQSVALKVKIDRNEPIIDSVQPLWAGANWPECETYDLLGINFKGHPDLHRILLGEDWIGYPLRKDYEPYDVEV